MTTKLRPRQNYFSDQEWQRIQLHARMLGMSAAAYIRQAMQETLEADREKIDAMVDAGAKIARRRRYSAPVSPPPS